MNCLMFPATFSAIRKKKVDVCEQTLSWMFHLRRCKQQLLNPRSFRDIQVSEISRTVASAVAINPNVLSACRSGVLSANF